MYQPWNRNEKAIKRGEKGKAKRMKKLSRITEDDVTPCSQSNTFLLHHSLNHKQYVSPLNQHRKQNWSS